VRNPLSFQHKSCCWKFLRPAVGDRRALASLICDLEVPVRISDVPGFTQSLQEEFTGRGLRRTLKASSVVVSSKHSFSFCTTLWCIMNKLQLSRRAGCCSCGAGIESWPNTKCIRDCHSFVQSTLGQYLKQATTFSTRPFPIIHPQIILPYWLTAQLLRMRDLRFTLSSCRGFWAWETLRCIASRQRFVRNVRTRYAATQRNNPVTAVCHIH